MGVLECWLTFLPRCWRRVFDVDSPPCKDTLSLSTHCTILVRVQDGMGQFLAVMKSLFCLYFKGCFETSYILGNQRHGQWKWVKGFQILYFFQFFQVALEVFDVTEIVPVDFHTWKQPTAYCNGHFRFKCCFVFIVNLVLGCWPLRMIGFINGLLVIA